MSHPPGAAAAAVELGGGFIYVRRPDGHGAVLAPHLQTAGVVGMTSDSAVNARDPSAVRPWLDAWGLGSAGSLAQVNQVHGTAVVQARPGEPLVDADGMWSDSGVVTLLVKAADCAPVWLADVASTRFALVHAGWRGVAGGIMASAVQALTGQGSQASELAVAIGPHLRPCCFEVGPQVAGRFLGIPKAVVPAETLTVKRQREDSLALDLAAAMRAGLTGAGVREEQIFVATACTRCHPELLHSYRHNGAGGPLMAAVAARRA